MTDVQRTSRRDQPYDGLLRLAEEIERGSSQWRSPSLPPPPVVRTASVARADREADARWSMPWVVVTCVASLGALAGVLVVDPTRSISSAGNLRELIGTSSADETVVGDGSESVGDAICDEASLTEVLGTIDGVSFRVDRFACQQSAAYVRLVPDSSTGPLLSSTVYAAVVAEEERWVTISTSWVEDCEVRVRTIEPSFPSELCDAIS